MTVKADNTDWLPEGETVGSELGFRVNVEPYDIGSEPIPNPACNN